MSLEAASFTLPLIFLSSSLLLISFILSSRSLRLKAGLKNEDGVLERTRHVLEFFYLSKSSCLWSVCVLFFSVVRKNKNDFKKISHFVTSST